MSSPQGTTVSSERAAVVAALRAHDRFLVTTHENPDGDALGSLVATTRTLQELGKDAVMYLSGTTPLPREYGFMVADVWSSEEALRAFEQNEEFRQVLRDAGLPEPRLRVYPLHSLGWPVEAMPLYR